MTIDIEKLADEFLHGADRNGAYYGFVEELKQFSEAYAAEKQRQQEPVAKIKAQWSCPDNLGKKHRERYVQFKNGIIPQEGTELFTYPPDADKVLEKQSAEIAQLKTLIKDDAFAISFQSMAQYRKSLLEAIK